MVNLLCFVLWFSHQYFFITIITSLLYMFAFSAVGNPEVNRDVCGQEVKTRCDMRDNFKSCGLQMFFGLSVVMTEQYVVHSAVKMSLAYLKY